MEAFATATAQGETPTKTTGGDVLRLSNRRPCAHIFDPPAAEPAFGEMCEMTGASSQSRKRMAIGAVAIGFTSSSL